VELHYYSHYRVISALSFANKLIHLLARLINCRMLLVVSSEMDTFRDASEPIGRAQQFYCLLSLERFDYQMSNYLGMNREF
jgi:hypothetical protein